MNQANQINQANQGKDREAACQKTGIRPEAGCRGEGMALRETEIRTLIVGTGAAGYQAAVWLHRCGERDMAILAEDVRAGTSRNTGSDKQTYYKLSLAGAEADSVRSMAEDLFAGQCVDGDLALCEAALSAKCFYHLIGLGVPFPDNEYGEYIGYQTDHDRRRRASSAGPYTSRMMTECLEREATARQIRVLNHMQVIRLLVTDNRIRGVLCLDRTDQRACAFVIIWCENVVLATGAPAGMYHDSVYPVSQLGSSGIAFEAGVMGKNLTEWQFGVASLRPRWNVSGTYMQALPRLVSTNRQGGDEQEFLSDYFEDPGEMQYLIFLKGYQWPFDAGKIYGGSSLIDLLIFWETERKGRRVFLDYLHNPGGEEVAFERLPKEAYDYLRAAGACLGTPIERLEHMNGPAVSFYREHGVDLHRELLEIAVCVQHNNGGLAVDADWQTNIRGIYAVGEVCGSHGVTRPGGSALNAGQAGAIRAAESIAYTYQEETGKSRTANREKQPADTDRNREAIKELCRAKARERMELVFASAGRSGIGEVWKRAAIRMSRAAGMIRDEKAIAQVFKEVSWELEHFTEEVKIADAKQAGMLFHLYDMLIAQSVYLSAMLDYRAQGGKSRGSALYTCPDGRKPGERMPELFRSRPDEGELGGMIQEIRLLPQELSGGADDREETEGEGNRLSELSDGGKAGIRTGIGTCQVSWRPRRPIPEPDYVFETQWKSFRERRGIT